MQVDAPAFASPGLGWAAREQAALFKRGGNVHQDLTFGRPEWASGRVSQLWARTHLVGRDLISGGGERVPQSLQ